MNKRQLKKIAKKAHITRDDAQLAWDTVVRYLDNTVGAVSYNLTPWNHKKDDIEAFRKTISLVNPEKKTGEGVYEDILVASFISS